MSSPSEIKQMIFHSMSCYTAMMSLCLKQWLNEADTDIAYQLIMHGYKIISYTRGGGLGIFSGESVTISHRDSRVKDTFEFCIVELSSSKNSLFIVAQYRPLYSPDTISRENCLNVFRWIQQFCCRYFYNSITQNYLYSWVTLIYTMMTMRKLKHKPSVIL